MCHSTSDWDPGNPSVSWKTPSHLFFLNSRLRQVRTEGQGGREFLSLFHLLGHCIFFLYSWRTHNLLLITSQQLKSIQFDKQALCWEWGKKSEFTLHGWISQMLHRANEDRHARLCAASVRACEAPQSPTLSCGVRRVQWLPQMGREGIDLEGAQKSFLGWWGCSIFWWQLWLREYNPRVNISWNTSNYTLKWLHLSACKLGLNKLLCGLNF